MVYDPLQNCVDQVLNSFSTESTQSGLSAAAPSESRLGEAVMDAEVANCSASKHGPGQSVKFLAAREHIDNQLYALDLCL
jgi:hypothetical protein